MKNIEMQHHVAKYTDGKKKSMDEKKIKTIGSLLKAAADEYGDKACIRYSSENGIVTRTYAELYRDSVKAARVISKAIGGGRAHVTVIGKTSYPYLCFLNGIFMSGCAAVPIAFTATADEIRELSEKADVTAVVFGPEVEERVCEAFAGSANLPVMIPAAEENASFSEELPEVDPYACAMIMFTSGTTGDKKGVMLSSAALVSNVFFKEMSYEGEHVALNVLPMHHIFCFSCDYLKNIRDGVTICLNEDASALYKNLLLYEPTVIRLVPMMTEGILKKTAVMRRRHPELSPRQAGELVFGRRLHSIISSGARLNWEKVAAFEEMGVQVRQGYGMTEAGPRIAVPNGQTDIASAGAIISTVTPRIRDGELQIKSPSLMSGYYKDERATAEAFTEDGWFRTGDTGYFTEDRILYITGRVKNLIILSNGENISPEEIERMLSEDPFVREVIVSEKDNGLWAEIYPEPEQAAELSTDELAEKAQTVVARYNAGAASEKTIDGVSLRSVPFEKTSSGKIKR